RLPNNCKGVRPNWGGLVSDFVLGSYVPSWKPKTKSYTWHYREGWRGDGAGGWCQTLFLVLTCRLGNQKQSLTPGTIGRDGGGMVRGAGVRLCSWFLRAVLETKNKVLHLALGTPRDRRENGLERWWILRR